MKGIFLEFGVSKRTWAKIDQPRKELPRENGQINKRVAPSDRRRVRGDDGEQENDRRMDTIHTESHFNFIKMQLLSQFGDDIRHLGNILMYSTEYGNLHIKGKIKDSWRHSIKTMWHDRSCKVTVVGMGFESDF